MSRQVRLAECSTRVQHKTFQQCIHDDGAFFVHTCVIENFDGLVKLLQLLLVCGNCMTSEHAACHPWSALGSSFN